MNHHSHQFKTLQTNDLRNSASTPVFSLTSPRLAYFLSFLTLILLSLHPSLTPHLLLPSHTHTHIYLNLTSISISSQPHLNQTPLFPFISSLSSAYLPARLPPYISSFFILHLTSHIAHHISHLSSFIFHFYTVIVMQYAVIVIVMCMPCRELQYIHSLLKISQVKISDLSLIYLSAVS